MSPTYEIAFTPSFLSSFDALEEKTRKHVREAIDKVVEGHASTDVHKLKGVPFVSFAVNQNALRVICHREDKTLVLCHVAPHDPAYEWAKRNRIAQAGSYLRLIRTIEESETKTAAPEGPLARVSNALFGRFGVQPRVANVLREIEDEDTLIEVLTHFPPHRTDALMGLASDPSDADTLAEAYETSALSPAHEKPISLAQALRSETNSAQVWLASPEDEAVKRALEGGLACWRVFLHPSQRRLARTESKGALKIGGGPGTGKTVVALHRARWLAEVVSLRDGNTTEPLPVLVTTFNSVLAKQLEPMLDELCADVPHVRERIAVLSTTRVAQELLKLKKRPNRLITEVEELWARALTHDTASRGRRFYDSERQHVLARHDAWTEEAYLQASRTGRTTRLDRAARKEVWRVLSAFESALSESGGGDDLALARQATQLLTSGELASPYAAVVCDEAQDLGATDLRLLAALARGPSSAIRPNALTLCGDAYQRLYRAPVPLSACGIEVRGRAKNLRLNYRSTDAIRAAAVRLLRGSVPEEADETDASTLDGYRALRRGEPPEERAFETPEAEASWIAELASQRDQGTLLVLARTHDWLEALKTQLVSRGHRPRILGNNDLPSDADTLVLCTLHRAKGLEAPRVVLAGRQLVPLRYPGGGDPADRAAWEAKELAALYVGMTRARDWCGVSTVKA